MTAARQDAWTPDEDLLLAEIVLTHIREGSTQLKAFEESGKKLKRTAAACGFRWNSNIRKQYKEGIELAKRQRNANKKDRSSNKKIQEGNEVLEKEKARSIILSDAVRFFKRLESEMEIIENYKSEIEKLKSKNQVLQKEKDEVIQKLGELQKEFNHLNDEYLSLLSLFDKARKMAKELI